MERGKLKGLSLPKLKKNDNAYIYKVVDSGILRYEVFKHKENTRFECVTYPSNKSFGIWAFTTPLLCRANEIFEELSILEGDQNI